MMTSVLRPFCLLTVLVALPALALADEQPATYGEGVDLHEPTPIAKILQDPDKYIGKIVRIDGGVLDVCPAKGCWIEVGNAEAKMRVKVEDDVIVFPRSAEGKIAAAQGRVEAVELDRQRYTDWLAHLAEERGETFDPETAEIGEGPFRLIQIQGTGASIQSTPFE